MINLSQPVSYSELGTISAGDLISRVKAFCSTGSNVHPDSLKAVVLKLAAYSRDLNITQAQRDEAADLATALANAAIKKYGKNSDYGANLMADIQAVLSRPAAA